MVATLTGKDELIICLVGSGDVEGLQRQLVDAFQGDANRFKAVQLRFESGPQVLPTAFGEVKKSRGRRRGQRSRDRRARKGGLS